MTLGLHLERTSQVIMEDHTEEQSDTEDSGSSPTATSPEMEDETLPTTSHPSPVASASPTSPTSPTSHASSSSSSPSSAFGQPHGSAPRPSKVATAIPRPSPHYPRSSSPVPTIQPRLRSRGLGLTPLTSTAGNSCHPLAPLGTGNLPKSQPLARALFAKMASGDTPHAGMGGKKKSGAQKLIVPTKGFKTRFELGLSASELARQ